MSDTKNTRNAAFLISDTKNGPYTKVNKTHGLKVAMPTDFGDDTGHGQQFKTAIPGLSDYKITLAKWYQVAFSTLEDAALNKESKFFMYYMDYADTQNYHRGECWIAFNEQNSDLGNVTGQTFDVTLASEDIQIVRGGVAL